MNNILSNDLLNELECPVCLDYMVPPIKMCQTGHSICQTCRSKLLSCPLCQKVFLEVRNISLENVIHKIHFPCVNKSLGCNAKSPIKQRDAHKGNCPFREYDCSVENCPWSGKLEDIINHWNSKHNMGPCNSNSITRLHVKHDLYRVNLIQAHGRLFWYKIQLKRGKIWWAVQYLGLEDEVKNYYYEIIIPKHNSKTYKFEDYCYSVNLGNEALFNECISINLDCLQPFIQENHSLTYVLNVKHRQTVPIEEIPVEMISKKFKQNPDGQT